MSDLASLQWQIEMGADEAIGEAPVAKDLPAAELAAWTNVATVLLNMDEAITKE